MRDEIFIDGVPPSVTEDELEILFSECGPVQSVELMKSTDGESLGIARMQLETSQAAEQAVRLFHHVKLDGKTLLVFRRSHTTETKPVLFRTGDEMKIHDTSHNALFIPQSCCS